MACSKPSNRGGAPKGHPKSGGRQKGTPNKITAEVRAAATQLVDDPVYRRKLRTDMRARSIAPAMETMLWHYAKGKPVDRQEIGSPGEFRRLSKEELKAQLQDALTKL